MAGGRPKKFGSAKELIDLWREFTDAIVDSKYTCAPTQTAFCRWLAENYEAADRRTIYNALNKYFPTIKSEFEQIQADVLAAGALLGAYNPTMAIFSLKNWCKWSDKQQVDANVDTEMHITFDSGLEDFTG